MLVKDLQIQVRDVSVKYTPQEIMMVESPKERRKEQKRDATWGKCGLSVPIEMKSNLVVTMH